MKKIKVAIFIFLVALATGIFNFLIVESTAKRLESYLDSTEKDPQLASEMSAFWERRSGILSIFVHHDVIDKITRSVIKTKTAAESGNDYFKKSQISVTRALVKTLKESDEISLKNVL
ncbi:MAG: DUF4363 family protein [Oscillospiraceae bacterium]|jgi:hypothetical protein|nr:DUF4363 family protein [Oscillospiraceae bacterium]